MQHQHLQCLLKGILHVRPNLMADSERNSNSSESDLVCESRRASRGGRGSPFGCRTVLLCPRTVQGCCRTVQVSCRIDLPACRIDQVCCPGELPGRSIDLPGCRIVLFVDSVSCGAIFVSHSGTRRARNGAPGIDPVGRRSRGAHFNPCTGQTSRRVFWQIRTHTVLPLSPSR